MNIINSKAQNQKVCNLLKRKMHPAVFSFYLKLSVKALMDVNVQYFENDRQGRVRHQQVKTFLDSGIYKYRQYINIFMRNYLDMVMKVMKAKIKIIIVKNDFTNVRMLPRGPCRFSQPRMTVTQAC